MMHYMKYFVLLCVTLVSFGIDGAFGQQIGGRPNPAGPGGVFDITSFAAKPDGKTNNALALVQAWNAACKSTCPEPPKLLIPPGNFSAGEVVFEGPCTAPKPITLEIQGTLLSDPDLSLYTQKTWISFEHIDGLVVNGGGTFHGQGEASWKIKDCHGDGCNSAEGLPDSIVFHSVNNSIMTNVHLVNSKGFHMKITSCSTNFTVDGITITAPEDSPNTDGIHISKSCKVNITNSVIGTGDDCVSIGDGNTDVFISKITCGPGHGISVGSLGKREGELDVKNVVITNCTLIKTDNGARIKTWHSPNKLLASGITFEDIIMQDVCNPIIIDQNYSSEKTPGGSNVKICDVHFRNIRGTTLSDVGVTLNCSSTIPCEGVELADIDLVFTGDKAKNPAFISTCENVKPIFTGHMNPPACPL